MNKLLIIFFIISYPLIGQFGSSWHVLGEMPRPVAGGEMIFDSGNLYIMGGYSDSTQAAVNWIQKYSTVRDVWKNLDTMGFRRNGFVVDRYNNEVIICGGIQDTSDNAGILEGWQINGERRKISKDPNFSRIFASGHIVNSKLYLIGGNQFLFDFASGLPYIVEYDLELDSIKYSFEGNFPVKLELPEQHISAVYGDDIFIFGGVLNGISNSIFKFNTISHTFEKLNVNLLEPRAAGRAVVSEFSRSIYILGGYNESREALRSVEIFSIDGSDYSITEGPSMNFARRNFMALIDNETIYILGGYDQNDKIVPEMEFLGASLTEIGNTSSNLKNEFELYQNYPNPFNPTTTIKYEIPNMADVRTGVNHRKSSVNSKLVGQHLSLPQTNVKLILYDIIGSEIETLVNESQFPGMYEVEFNAKSLPSGIYLYKLQIGKFSAIKKMIVLR